MSVTDEELLKQYERDLALSSSTNQSSQIPYSSAMFANQQKQNLIEWELDFKPELEAIERLLKCDVIKRDENGNEYWAENPDKERIFLNELGVNDVMRNITLINNKGKALSYYRIDEISLRVKTITHEIRVLIYNNYELYGIDNDYKMNNYSMTVLSIGSVIEDVYRRAMNGETHKGLADQRIVTQNDGLNNGGNQGYPMMMPQQQSKKSLFKPWTWLG
jgi:hypothetical protein